MKTDWPSAAVIRLPLAWRLVGAAYQMSLIMAAVLREFRVSFTP